MGEALFDAVPEFRELEEKIDAMLGYSLRQLCLADPHSRLGQTQYAQPAIYITNALHFYKVLSDGVRPSAFAGHSLGEYNALMAAGVFDLLTGLKLVKRRGELMAQASNGSMSAVTGFDSSKIAAILRVEGLTGIDVANFNSPTQTVISGPVDELKRAATPLERAGAQMCVPLPVSAAFHSRYMAAAARAFDEFVESVEFDFKVPQLAVISNVTGRPYPTGNPNATVRSLLVKQIVQPVQWVKTVLYLRNAGIAEFREIGTGNVLTRLADQIHEISH
jgi:malonyl CoA-acyl carrier protein transacylase